MDFKHIQLPNIVIADLYKNSLVLVEEENIGNISKTLVEEKSSFINKQLLVPEVVSISRHVVQSIENKIIDIPVNTVSLQDNVESSDFNSKTDLNRSPKINIISPINPNPPFGIKYLGGFGKKISIVLEDHFHPNINDGDLVFLTKLLQACKLSLNDVAIINVVSNAASAHQLWQTMPAEKMIIFEIDPGTLGLPFRLSHFKLQPWSDCVFLASPSLQALQEGAPEKITQLKRNLWESLKKMFLP